MEVFFFDCPLCILTFAGKQIVALRECCREILPWDIRSPCAPTRFVTTCLRSYDVALRNHNLLTGHRWCLVGGWPNLHNLLEMGWHVKRLIQDVRRICADLQVSTFFFSCWNDLSLKHFQSSSFRYRNLLNSLLFSSLLHSLCVLGQWSLDNLFSLAYLFVELLGCLHLLFLLLFPRFNLWAFLHLTFIFGLSSLRLLELRDFIFCIWILFCHVNMLLLFSILVHLVTTPIITLSLRRSIPLLWIPLDCSFCFQMMLFVLSWLGSVLGHVFLTFSLNYFYRLLQRFVLFFWVSNLSFLKIRWMALLLGGTTFFLLVEFLVFF